MAKKKEKCSLFEEMLMWTSYRYCIGRHTYVTSLAIEMAQHYYDKLDDEKMKFTAMDIRREIYDHLKWLPFSFEIRRMYDSDPFNPLDVLFEFIETNDINSYDELVKYSNILYNSHTGSYQFNKCEPTIRSYFSINDIDDLIPWDNLAACFDKKNHKIVTTEYEGKIETHRCFKSWKRKSFPCEDKPGYYQHTEFGWEPVWIPLDTFLAGNQYRYIANEYITKVEDINEVQ